MEDVQERDLVVLLASDEDDGVQQLKQLGNVEPPDRLGDLTVEKKNVRTHIHKNNSCYHL